MNYLLGHYVKPGRYTRTRPYHFTNTREAVFGGRTIPANAECRFFETTNFGWIIWKDPTTGDNHIARE